MGYKERVTVSQIRQFTNMESNDEIRAKLEEEVCEFKWWKSLWL
jgi:hypothetical protein